MMARMIFSILKNLKELTGNLLFRKHFNKIGPQGLYKLSALFLCISLNLKL